MIIKLIICALIGYAFGCVPSGVLIGKAFGVKDIREHGSGNIGTTNVLRTLGWLPSVLTLLCDAAKGAIAAFIGKYLGGTAGLLIAAFMTLVGHCAPATLGFKGGKGIATSLGVMFAVCWPVALCYLGIALPIVGLTGYMSLGSLTASGLNILLMWIFCPKENMWMYLVFAACQTALTMYCHRGNISRLVHGTENKLNFKKIKKGKGGK